MSRKIRVNRKTSADERIKLLVEFDEYHLNLIAKTVDSMPSPGCCSGTRSKNCCVRMLTMLFSDEHATQFAQTGGKLTRQHLDAGEIHAKSAFWRDFTADFNNNRTEFNCLLSANARFAELDHSVVGEHTAVELYDIWKVVLLKYQRALANFTKCGDHDEDFFGYCSG
ncbi:hypothetical protein PI125_g14693 [Phytophthora idaei]|nr:hypothetical protein PI125_g14693 [Phytophthora idaei]